MDTGPGSRPRGRSPILAGGRPLVQPAYKGRGARPRTSAWIRRFEEVPERTPWPGGSCFAPRAPQRGQSKPQKQQREEGSDRNSGEATTFARLHRGILSVNGKTTQDSKNQEEEAGNLEPELPNRAPDGLSYSPDPGPACPKIGMALCRLADNTAGDYNFARAGDSSHDGILAVSNLPVCGLLRNSEAWVGIQ